MQGFKTVTGQYVVVVTSMARHCDEENNVVYRNVS